MSKKTLNNNGKIINLIIKKKKYKIHKNLSKIKTSLKGNIISSKFVLLKAKKNQLRCHYCKLLMLRRNYARHLKSQHSDKFKKIIEIKNRNIFNRSNTKLVSKSESITERIKNSISKLSESEEFSESLTSKINDKNNKKEDIDDYYNEFAGTEENRINLILKFGNIDFNGTIICKLPDNNKYTIYTFPKPSFIWEKAITKYDIPQLCFNRPSGFSLFSSISDIKKIKNFYIKILSNL